MDYLKTKIKNVNSVSSVSSCLPPALFPAQHVLAAQPVLVAIISWVLLLGVAFGTNQANAAEELLWRAVNDSKAEIVPAYSGSMTVFSVKEAPEVKPKAVVNFDLSPEERRKEQAAVILKEIREILKNTDIFNPDVRNVKIKAKLSGKAGKSVLISNYWLKKGDEISVPVTAKENIYSLLSDLAAINEELANSMEAEIDEKLMSAKDLKLKVSHVGKDFVELIDVKGSKHVIFFQAMGL